MPKVRLNVGDFDPDAAPATGFSNYAGPVPPAGLYRCRAKLWRLTKASTGNTMIKVIFEIDEPKNSEKSEYNGYAIWHNLVLVKKASPFVNAALVAMGINPKALSNDVVVKPDKTTDIVAIGGKKVNGIPVLVTAKRATFEGNIKLEATSFAAAAPISEVAGEDDIFGGGDDAVDPFADGEENPKSGDPHDAAAESDDPWAVVADGEAY